MMEKSIQHLWAGLGSALFWVSAAAILFFSPPSQKTDLSSQGTAFDFYVSGRPRLAYETLMASELPTRPLNETSVAAIERLLFALYSDSDLGLSASEAAEAFGRLLARPDLPTRFRDRLLVYEQELKNLDQQSYSVQAFLDQVQALDDRRMSMPTKTDSQMGARRAENERFRVYYAHGIKKWLEQPSPSNLRWLFAAGHSGSLYFAQGAEYLEVFLKTCQSLEGDQRYSRLCLDSDLIVAQRAYRLIREIDSPIGDERE